MEQALAMHMEIARKVYHVNISYDQLTKDGTTGSARVTCVSRTAAKEALQALHGSTFAENVIGVSPATEKMK